MSSPPPDWPGWPDENGNPTLPPKVEAKKPGKRKRKAKRKPTPANDSAETSVSSVEPLVAGLPQAKIIGGPTMPHKRTASYLAALILGALLTIAAFYIPTLTQPAYTPAFASQPAQLPIASGPCIAATGIMTPNESSLLSFSTPKDIAIVTNNTGATAYVTVNPTATQVTSSITWTSVLPNTQHFYFSRDIRIESIGVCVTPTTGFKVCGW